MNGAMVNSCNAVPSTGESFVTCREEDWQIYVASFARNLCQDFDADNASTQHSNPPSNPPTEIFVMGKKTKKPQPKKRKGSELVQHTDDGRSHDGKEKRMKKAAASKKTARRSKDPDESEESDGGESKSGESEEEVEDDVSSEEEEEEEEEEDENGGKVTPEAGDRQRSKERKDDDDDDSYNSFDEKSTQGQLHWLQDVLTVSPESNFPNDFHKNRTTFMNGISCIIRQNEELKKEVMRHRANWEILRSSKKAKKEGNLTVAQQQILLEAKGAIINKVCRMIKFPKTGWELYSRNPNSVFDSMIRTQVSFPTGLTESQIEILWNDVIAPALPRALTNAKNRILQDVKKRFLGRL
jgi:hypothetical protein